MRRKEGSNRMREEEKEKDGRGVEEREKGK